MVAVTTSAALKQALIAATDGTEILLAPGRYSAGVVRNIKRAGIVIRSADPAKPAKITDMTMRDCTGIRFEGLEFAVDVDRAPIVYDIEFFNCQNIEMVGVHVHGTLDGNSYVDRRGPLFQGCTNVRVIGCEFQQLRFCLNHINCTDLKFIGNSCHDTRQGGIWGGGSNNVEVRENLITNIHYVEPDHPDAINFWTTNTTTRTHDILIKDNVYLRGSGRVSQGIFLRDQKDTLPYLNVEIAGNLVIGGLYNGIAVDGGENISIHDNFVAGLPDMKSRIYLRNVKGRLVDNQVSYISLEGTTNTLEKAGNVEFGTVLDNGEALTAKWLEAHPGLTMLPDLKTLKPRGAETPVPIPPEPAPIPTPVPPPNPEPVPVDPKKKELLDQIEKVGLELSRVQELVIGLWPNG